jgi:sulfate permease, SulP family
VPTLATNRELLGLGAANLASALSGGFTVTGSISRSAVNHAAGANTPLAGLITAALVSVVLCIPNGWLALLPLPAMAATIVMAVAGMVDVGTLLDSWRHDRSDALAWLATLAGVLLIGVEEGVVLGVLLSMASLVWRSSRPHIAVVGRLRGSGHFRNVERHSVETLPGVLFLRINSAMVSAIPSAWWSGWKMSCGCVLRYVIWCWLCRPSTWWIRRRSMH